MIPGDPKQWRSFLYFLRSEDKGSSLQAMHKYGKVKSFRLVKHIGKGFAIALLYDLTSVVRVLHEDMLLWSMSREGVRSAYEDAHHSFIDGRQIIVDYKRQQLMP
ncbi:hypothetical protein Bca52824_075085 [Brassica carinata]|uniref:Uncharacterized protein n=1 Tax=Brassica carinata TaxID=52824 RepID=A0A8X7PPP5_BRACI|nr:hypothetical protein Bca52824_075085 [Brassica carinata]